MLKRLYRFIRLDFQLSPRIMLIDILFILLSGISLIVSPLLIKMIYELIEGTDTSEIMVLLWIGVYFLNMTLFGSTNNLEEMLIAMCTKKTRTLFNVFFLHKSDQIPQDRLYSTSFHDEYQFAYKNLEKTANLSVVMINRVGLALFSLLLTCIGISMYDGLMCLVIIILSLIISYANICLTRKKIRLSRDYVPFERKAEYYKSLLTTRKYAKDIHLSPNTEWIQQEFQKNLKESVIHHQRHEVFSIIISRGVGIIETSLPYLFAIYFLYRVSAGRLSAGEALYLVGIVGTLKWSIKSLVSILTSELMEDMEYAKNFEAFLGKNLGQYRREVQNVHNTMKKREPLELLELKNIFYRYPEGTKEAVSNVNLSLKEGEIVAILGFNGSGKTTLSKIICGILKDYQGQIIINGVDARTMDSREYAQWFGMVFQDYNRYSFLLRENIGVGCIDEVENQPEIDQAVSRAHARDIVDKLPRGYEEQMGKNLYEDGLDMSGGEWQRIAIARGHMGNSPILVFDEPTASIDPIEEERFLTDLRSGLAGRTAILISHRISFSRLADRILIMDQGMVMEEGSHEELILKDGMYAQMYRAQKELYQEERSWGP